MIDLTVAAVPMYFGSIAVEQRALKRRAEIEGPSQGDYERRDTLTSLAMGTGSLIAPYVARPLVAAIRPKAGRYGKAAVAAVVGTAVATQIADVVARRTTSSTTRERAERVAGFAAPASMLAGGTIVAASWAGATSSTKLFDRRICRDLGEGVLAWTVAIVGWDFAYYWNHRIGHERRQLWANHSIHHSSERYNLSTALRQAWADSLGTYLPYGMGLFGVRPNLVQQARGINLIYQFWIHTELIGHLGAFEKVFNTPSLHRVHHGMNRQYLDKNYGGILIIWDRMFGTHELEDEPVVYGLTKNINTFNPLRVVTAEWAEMWRDSSKARNWSTRLKAWFGRTGWSATPKA